MSSNEIFVLFFGSYEMSNLLKPVKSNLYKNPTFKQTLYTL